MPKYPDANLALPNTFPNINAFILGVFQASDVATLSLECVFDVMAALSAIPHRVARLVPEQLL